MTLCQGGRTDGQTDGRTDRRTSSTPYPSVSRGIMTDYLRQFSTDQDRQFSTDPDKTLTRHDFRPQFIQ